jgi:excisionase family DNA binding protein
MQRVSMTDTVLIPLPGIGVLELTREAYEAGLRPIGAPSTSSQANPATELVTAKALAHQMSLPVSCIYEYARAGRIPSVRAGKHVRFSPPEVLAALQAGDEASPVRR